MATDVSGRTLGYLSGAPRVSTRPEAAASGPQSHVLGVIRAFERLGWSVQPFIVGDRVPLSWVTREADKDLGRSYFIRLAADLIRLSLSVVSGYRALREVGRVHWVYERFGAFQALGYRFQRRGVPWILETNGLFFIEAAHDRRTLALRRVERALELWAYRQADVVICVSEELQRLVVDHGVDEAKILVVTNGVDTERFRPNAPPERLLDLPTIGFVGTLIGWQGIDVLIKALAQLRTEGMSYGLVVVGDGPMRKEWEEMARELGLADLVRFVGRAPGDRVPSYIAAFALGYTGHMALSSGEMYHSPLKLYEYMSMAKPVVASAFGDAGRVVKDGEIGYLFEPGNVEDLKRALRRAHAERAMWPELGAWARELVVDQHSWEARVREMISRVEPILEARYGTPYPGGRRHLQVGECRKR